VIRQHAPPADGRPRQATSRAVLAVIGGLLPLGAFAVLGALVAGEGARGWDADLLRYSDRHYRPSTAAALSTTLEVAVWLGAAIVAGVVVLLFLRRQRGQALFFALAVGGVVALDVPLKELFHRPPWSPAGYDSGAGYAFPSGHAMATMATVAAIAFLLPRWRTSVLAAGMPLMVAGGTTLVYAWWHYPSDVVAGWCFALAWVTVLWLLFHSSSWRYGFNSSADPRARHGSEDRRLPRHSRGPVLNTGAGEGIRDAEARLQSTSQHRV
jgi:membrane-associated phospholipid phosphatase